MSLTDWPRGSRVDLDVPYEEKDMAKRLGARWDSYYRVWHVHPGVDMRPFERWLPIRHEYSVRARSYFVAESDIGCWKCGKVFSVNALMLPAGHEDLEPGDDESPEAIWYQRHSVGMLTYVTSLPATVAHSLKTLAPNYWVDYSQTTRSEYWMNHCAHCGAKQGDFPLLCEVGSPFRPMDEKSASLVTVRAFDGPFHAIAGLSYSSPCFFNSMRLA